MRYNIFWFRRDLRLKDNAGLFHALKSGYPVKPIFIFDKVILGKIEDNFDARVTFIHECIDALDVQLKSMGSSLQVYYGTPMEVFMSILKDDNVASVYANRDYEKYAIVRDREISSLLAASGRSLHSSKDHVIFE